ncbi:MAG: DUF4339 domain-containing protein [Verrucomicrobiota bacterium JB022]|nr:DUF4339 domain-containing protein [Verrucomicrobiota bacterium JB022]
MKWFYEVDGEEFGPISSEEIVERIMNGEVSADTLVRREGQGAAVPAAETELVEFFDEMPEVYDSTARNYEDADLAGDAFAGAEDFEERSRHDDPLEEEAEAARDDEWAALDDEELDMTDEEPEQTPTRSKPKPPPVLHSISSKEPEEEPEPEEKPAPAPRKPAAPPHPFETVQTPTTPSVESIPHAPLPATPAPQSIQGIQPPPGVKATTPPKAAPEPAPAAKGEMPTWLMLLVSVLIVAGLIAVVALFL